MKKFLTGLLLLTVCAAMLLPIPAFAAAGFSDVPDYEWYVQDVERAVADGILHGDPEGTFRPTDNVTHGEFYTIMLNCLHWINGLEFDAPVSGSGHWALPFYEKLRDLGALLNVSADDTPRSLDAPISRYEVALIAANCLFHLGSEEHHLIAEPEKIFADYGEMPYIYRYSAVQLYGIGVLSGYPDGCFHGDREILRSEMANVICRIIHEVDRVEVPDSVYYSPVALQWQQNGWINPYGNASPELCEILTGHSDRAYFYSEADAAGHIVQITVPVWRVDSRGQKYGSEATLTVNKAVEKDVRAIFETIFNDPERFPIYDAGCLRFGDTMRHAWACAIDINADYNAECRGYYDGDMNLIDASFSCGRGWWPAGTDWTPLAGSLPYASIYSIPRDGSVVRAFREYGWGWGGNGWSLRTSDMSRGFDYMHFSVMASGG